MEICDSHGNVKEKSGEFVLIYFEGINHAVHIFLVFRTIISIPTAGGGS